jgi:hypothetical protein
MAFEDHIYTRLSHYSYEIFNNKLRLFPKPVTNSGFGFFQYMWFDFTVDDATEPWDPEGDIYGTQEGINNMNTLPFDNIPYQNINAIGKQWIRRYALALAKETLGLVRSKFGTIPIPGDNVNLNGDALISAAREEQANLKEELKTNLEEMTYAKLVERDAQIAENTVKVQEEMPLLIYQG